MTAGQALFRAYAFMAAANLSRVVVRLAPDPDDASSLYPQTVAAWRKDGTRTYGGLSRLACLVWDAATDAGVDTGPVALTSPGAGPARVEAVECPDCRGTGAVSGPEVDELCQGCADGWAYVPKRREGAA